MDGNGGKKELLDLIHQQIQTPTAKGRSLWVLLSSNLSSVKLLLTRGIFPLVYVREIFPSHM